MATRPFVASWILLLGLALSVRGDKEYSTCGGVYSSRSGDVSFSSRRPKDGMVCHWTFQVPSWHRLVFQLRSNAQYSCQGQYLRSYIEERSVYVINGSYYHCHDTVLSSNRNVRLELHSSYLPFYSASGSYRIEPLSFSEAEEIVHDGDSTLARSCLNGGVGKMAPNLQYKCICLPGFGGQNCDKACGWDRYGNECEKTCSNTPAGCKGRRFRIGDDWLCASGLKGPNCDHVCESGYYGSNCTLPCGNCEGGKPCDPTTGHCQADCSTGFLSPFCVEELTHLEVAPAIAAINGSTLNGSFSLKSEDRRGRGLVVHYRVEYKEVAHGHCRCIVPLFYQTGNPADQATLHEAEMIVANEIEERSKKITTETRTRQSRKTVSIPQTATTNQVAAALGERIKPRPAVEKEAQLLKAAGKDEASTRQNVELRVDANLTSAKNAKLTSAKKNLFGSDDEQDDSDNASSPEVSMDEDEAEEDEQEEKGDNNAADFDGCSACNELRTAVTKPVPEFLSVLQNFCLVKMGKAIQRNLDLKPIPSNMATTLLSKGFKVQIAIHDKNSIKSESEGNPNNIVRECLIKLYGKDQIESNNLTAKGTRAGTLGIAEDVRQAIKSFANRNKGPGYKDLTNANITKIINRKNNQLRRVSKGGSSEKKKKTLKRKGRSSKGSPPKVISPAKPDAPTPKKDEAKALIATSPWKVMEHSKGQINYSSTEQPNLHWGMHGDSWNATPSSSWQWQQHPTEQPYYGNNFFSHAQQQNSNVHQAPWHQDTNNYQSL